MSLSSSLRVPLFLLAGATLVAFTPLTSRGEERPTPEVVRQLIPELRSSDDAVRDAAEDRLFALGKSGRQALEKLARDADPQVAGTALRLLSNPRWSRPDGPRGERTLRRVQRARDDAQRDLAEARRRADEILRRGAAVASGLRSGMILDDQGRFSWTVDGEGRVKVTVQPQDGGETLTYEADSLEALKEREPDIAGRLDEVLADDGFSVRLRLPEFPELPALPPLPRLPDMSDFEELARRLGESRWPQGDVDAIAEWLAEREGRAGERAAQRADRPLLGIEWVAPSAALRAHLGIESGGMLVERVVPESLAARLGLAEHDVLLRLGDTSIATPADIREALGAAAEGTTIEAEVVRCGERRTLSAQR